MFAPEPNAILTPEETAAWLKVRPRQLRRMGVPALDYGPRTTRYRVADVLQWLDQFKQQRTK